MPARLQYEMPLCRYLHHQPTDFWFLFGLTSKSCEEALSACKTAYALAIKSGHDVRALLTDNGTEYTAFEFSEYLAEIGVMRQFSAPGRQDQNGKSERSWRTLSEAAVTHFAESGLEKGFWLFSFSYTVFWQNRSGTVSLFEAFFGFPPKLISLRGTRSAAWSCICGTTRLRPSWILVRGAV